MAQEAGASWIDLVAPIAAVLGLLVAVFGIVQPIRASFLQARITQLESRLNNFCAPFYNLRRRSEKLWLELKSGNVADMSQRFNLVEELLNGKQFAPNDKVLIAEIVSLGVECEKLIQQHGGLWDEKELRDNVFPDAANHFRFMKLISEGKVVGEADRFTKMKFRKKEVDDALNNMVRELQKELTELKQQLTFWGWVKHARK